LTARMSSSELSAAVATVSCEGKTGIPGTRAGTHPGVGLLYVLSSIAECYTVNQVLSTVSDYFDMAGTAQQTVDDVIRELDELKTPADKALMARITRFFVDAITDLSREDKTAALKARDDILVVIETVARRSAEQSPKYAVKLRGAIQKQKLLEEEGGVIGPAEVGKLLGMSRQAVGQRRAGGRLLGVPVAGGYVYPIWQFTEGETLKGLEEILAALAEHDAWMKLVFFLNQNRALGGRRPLDVLRRGETDRVLRAARLYLQQGAA